MRQTIFLLFAASLTLATAAAFAGDNTTMNKPPMLTNAARNPFFTPSTLPYHMPPFDQIKDEHFVPAFAEAMRQHLAEVQAIADSPEAPTFANTVVARGTPWEAKPAS